MAKHPSQEGSSPNSTRREFLRASALGAAALGAAPASAAQQLLRASLGDALPMGGASLGGTAGLGKKTERIVLVAFAGGVRTKEVLETPGNAPNIHRIAKAGVTLPNMRCTNSGHYGAALSLFTGQVENMGIRENQRGINPTLFERLRKDLGLNSNDVWLSTSGGAQSRLFAHSDNPGYGKEHAASVLDGDGIFNVEFKKILQSFGRPKLDSEAERDILKRLGDSLDRDALGNLATSAPDPAEIQRVEQFILDELQGGATNLTGPGASDAKAIRIAANILRVFKPKVLTITLQNHDIAHGSFNGYVDVIRRNDEELGKLWDAIQQDQELKETTAVVVMPEFGRDEDINERNGLDHGDGSDSMRKVFLVAAGPDFVSGGKVIRKEHRTIDICPTVLSLFDSKAPRNMAAKPIRSLFA